VNLKPVICVAPVKFGRHTKCSEFQPQIKQDGRKATLREDTIDISGTFLFEVVFRDLPFLGETRDSPAGDQSVIVEVESDVILKTATDLPLGEDARQCAKELAPHFAMQVVQKDLPHNFEPPYSVMEIDQLPSDLHHRPPKFQGNWFRAWLR
jgi:hypothetical protein